jgi:tetratricopeptide (TPR) repeat protein
LARLPKARADLVVGIADIYFQAQEFEKALRFAEDAQEIDSDYPESYRIQGDIYLREIRIKKENRKRALEAYKAYSDRKVSDPYGYIQRFDIFLKEGSFDLAEEELQRVSEVSPRYPELHFRRARMLSKMGRMKDALNELEREIEMNPRHVLSWLDLGELRTKAGDLDEASKCFNKAMTLDPQSPYAKIGAGYVAYLRRQYGPAIALYQAALAMDKGNPEVHKKLGLAYKDSGDQTAANRHFQNYLDLAPDAPDRTEIEALKR